eukprot:gene22023-26532_t
MSASVFYVRQLISHRELYEEEENDDDEEEEEESAIL